MSTTFRMFCIWACVVLTMVSHEMVGFERTALTILVLIFWQTNKLKTNNKL